MRAALPESYGGEYFATAFMKGTIGRFLVKLDAGGGQTPGNSPPLLRAVGF
jgi:hypothetical protein